MERSVDIDIPTQNPERQIIELGHISRPKKGR